MNPFWRARPRAWPQGGGSRGGGSPERLSSPEKKQGGSRVPLQSLGNKYQYFQPQETQGRVTAPRNSPNNLRNPVTAFKQAPVALLVSGTTPGAPVSDMQEQLKAVAVIVATGV